MKIVNSLPQIWSALRWSNTDGICSIFKRLVASPPETLRVSPPEGAVDKHSFNGRGLNGY